MKTQTHMLGVEAACIHLSKAKEFKACMPACLLDKNALDFLVLILLPSEG